MLSSKPLNRPAVQPAQPPFKRISGSSSGLKLQGRGTTYLHLVPKSRMSGGVPRLPISLKGVHKFNFTFTTTAVNDWFL